MILFFIIGIYMYHISFFFACVVYVCVYAHSCEQRQMFVATVQMCTCGGPKDIRGLLSLSDYLLQSDLSLILVHLASQFATGITISYLLSVRITADHYTCSRFFMGSGDSNSSLLTCTTSSLLLSHLIGPYLTFL